MAPAGLDELSAKFLGNVLQPGDPAFDKATAVWAVSGGHQGALPTPAVVVQPTCTSDVVAAVKFATAHGLPLATRGGGHGAGNPSWVDGGLMIDLSLMRSVYADPVAQTAVVDGGALACHVDAETALHGLCTPLGVCAVVGMGQLLNGGLSLLSRAYGPGCDAVVEAQLVLADGSVINAAEAGPDPELLWALRGAGSTLGVCTKLKLRLRPAPTYSGMFVWKDDPAHDTFKAIMRWIRSTVLPDDGIGFNCGRSLHPEHGPVLVSMFVITDDRPLAEKEVVVAPLRALGPLQDTVGASTWLQTNMSHYEGVTGLKKAFPVHYESAIGGHVAAEKFDDAFIDAFVRCTADELPLPECGLTLAFIELMGGALKRSKSPVGMNQAEFQWVSQVGWRDPASAPAALRYRALLAGTLGPLSSSMARYINLVDVAHGATDPPLSYTEAAEKSGGAANFERVKAVKAKYDPKGVFSQTPYMHVLAAPGP